jgi:endonuclease YncB( thermonuclease family)
MARSGQIVKFRRRATRERPVGVAASSRRSLRRERFKLVVTSAGLLGFFALVYVSDLRSVVPSGDAFGHEVVGIANVIDGDSLRVEGVEIRLRHIDAVEFGQRCERDGDRWACGQAAASALARLARGSQIRCATWGTDVYDRKLATCYTPNGANLNRELVELGWAVATDFRYQSTEHRARFARAGIWDSDFELPRVYRRTRS